MTCATEKPKRLSLCALLDAMVAEYQHRLIGGERVRRVKAGDIETEYMEMSTQQLESAIKKSIEGASRLNCEGWQEAAALVGMLPPARAFGVLGCVPSRNCSCN